MNDIGARIKKYRKDKGFTQQQLADSIGKSKSIIQKYEANDTTPPIDVLGDIAKALQIPIDLLIGSRLIPIEHDGEFKGFIDSQFGFFNPQNEVYADFIERKITDFKEQYNNFNEYSSDKNIDILEEILNGFNELENSFNKFKQDYIVGVKELVKSYKQNEKFIQSISKYKNYDSKKDE